MRRNNFDTSDSRRRRQRLAPKTKRPCSFKIVNTAYFAGSVSNTGGLNIDVLIEGGGVRRTEVIDDGVGMSDDELSKAFNGKLQGFHRGYGIRNIIDRLKIYYNGGHNVKVLSSPGGGTRVIITLERGKDLGQNAE